jgi:hypothetical protein
MKTIKRFNSNSLVLLGASKLTSQSHSQNSGVFQMLRTGSAAAMGRAVTKSQKPTTKNGL